MPEARAHVLISGRVQGVSFRYHTQQRALSIGVNGWVRNLRDGRVEAVFEGQKERVERIVKWCGHGPSSAQVERVTVDWQPSRGESQDFVMRMTSSGRST